MRLLLGAITAAVGLSALVVGVGAVTGQYGSDDAANVALYNSTTPQVCTGGLDVPAQTATFAAYTQTPIDWQALPTCDLSRP